MCTPCTADTRFGSNLIMLQRLLDVKAALQLMVEDAQWKKWTPATRRRAVTEEGADEPEARRDKESTTATINDADFWKFVSVFVRLCKPIMVLLRTVDTPRPTMGDVYYQFFTVWQHIDTFEGYGNRSTATGASAANKKRDEVTRIFYDRYVASPFQLATGV